MAMAMAMALALALALGLTIQGLTGNSFEIIIGSRGFFEHSSFTILRIEIDGGDGGGVRLTQKRIVERKRRCPGGGRRHHGIELIGRWGVELGEHTLEPCGQIGGIVMDGIRRKMREAVSLSITHQILEKLQLLGHLSHVGGPHLIPQHGQELVHATVLLLGIVLPAHLGFANIARAGSRRVRRFRQRVEMRIQLSLHGLPLLLLLNFFLGFASAAVAVLRNQLREESGHWGLGIGGVLLGFSLLLPLHHLRRKKLIINNLYL
jgi:hypothetical protein